MRNTFFTLLFSFIAVFGSVGSANASVTAGNIFATIGGTTTVDRGGAIHSQARSIYSLGGGMTSFQGKKVTLMAVDPPSFSAGCTGISWHFGGFAFISVDEIRQMVEAISQASLGIAIDLAMQTLCPQCYAVMSKLRDIANAMRNAAADACSVAKNFGAMLQKSGIFTANNTQTSCAQIEAGEGKSDGILNSFTTGACKLLNGAESAMKEYGGKIESFLTGGNAGAGKTPTKDQIDRIGNISYETMDALGFADGFVKDMLLSYTGMVIVTPEGNTDCRTSFRNLVGSAKDVGATQDEVDAILATADARTLTPTSSTNVTPDDATTTPAKTEPGGSATGKQICYAPPLITGLKAIAMSLICGFDPASDMKTFSTRFNLKDEELADSSLGAMCNSAMIKSEGAILREERLQDTVNMWMYRCDAISTARCLNPKMQRMTAAMNTGPSSGQYTGLAWMILDSLYQGVVSVANNEPLPARTVAILNGSGYPLYRLINIAAVYPGMAGELIHAYGAVIATHYALDTLTHVASPGAIPNIGLQGGKAIELSELNRVRSDIMNMMTETGPMRERVLKRLSEKRVLIDTIIQINKALQAEVMSSGLAGNANLAVSLKRQMSTVD